MKRSKVIEQEAAEKSDPIQIYGANKLDYGVIISTCSNPFRKTTTVTFVPRYVIMNESAVPIIISQDKKGADRQHLIQMKERINYHFQDADDAENYIKIRQPLFSELQSDGIIKKDQINKLDWSSRFTINNFIDFQVSVDAREDAESKGKYYEPKWNDPSEDNGFRRYLKVSITSEDDATVFIIITTPNMPEYRIKNYSNEQIKVYQKGLKDYKIDRQ